MFLSLSLLISVKMGMIKADLTIVVKTTDDIKKCTLLIKSKLPSKTGPTNERVFICSEQL